MQKYQIIKNNKGFTLVEVIVVAVIVLILAAVAIPLYMGYVNGAKKGALENAAGSIATACGSYYAVQGGDDPCEELSEDGGDTGKFIELGDAPGGTEKIGVNIPARMTAEASGGKITVTYTDDDKCGGEGPCSASATYKQ